MDISKQLLRVAKITKVNPWVALYQFVSAQGPLSSFLPGQYINLFYEIDGTTTSRPYSLASSPREAEKGYYEIYIHGGGPFTSAWLFENVREGDVLTASQPLGEFHLPPNAKGSKVIGISGGMSATPLLSVAKALCQGDLDGEFTLFCAWDTAEEVLCRQELLAYAESCARFKVVFVVQNNPQPGDEAGLVTREIVEKHCDITNGIFYLCGPGAMYTFLENEFAPLALPRTNWITELPGEASYEMIRPASPEKEKIYCLRVWQGDAVHILPLREQETVLTALERGGLSPLSRCRSGVCDFCLSHMKSGEIIIPKGWDARTPSQKAQNLIHPCCSFPLSDIELMLVTDE